jgi:PAS domain S-box-containing protein
MDIDREGLSRIKELLKNNPHGMNVTEIARDIGMNRLSAAKYLEMLVISGHIDVKAFGSSKVFYLSQRLPISAMLSLSSDFIIILDKDLRVINVNDRFLEFTDMSRAEILYKKLETLSFPIKFDPPITTSVVTALGGKELSVEGSYKKKDQEHLFNIKFIPLVFDDGQKGVTLLFEDITERKHIEEALRKSRDELEKTVDERTLELKKANESLHLEIFEKARAEEALRESEIKYRIVADNTGDWEFWLGTDGQFKYMSPSCEKITGYAANEFVKDPELFTNVVHPDDRQLFENHINHESRKTQPEDLEYRIITKKGETRWMHHLSKPIFDDTGCFIGTRGNNRDITDHKHAQDALFKAHVLLDTLLNQALIGFTYIDRELRFVLINEKLAELHGIPASEHIGKRVHDIVPTLASTIQKVVDQILATGQPVKDYEFSGETAMAPGVLRYWSESWYPMRDISGEITGFGAVVEEITERKHAEEALKEKWEQLKVQAEELESQAEELRINNNELEKEIMTRQQAQNALESSEMRFRSLIQNSSDIIRILDKDGLIIYDSPSSMKILGYPEGYMLGKSPIDFIHPNDRDVVQNDLSDVYNKKNSGKPTEFRIRKADGEYIAVESVGVNMIDVPGVDGIVITTRPIAERKKAEEAIRQSEEMLRIAISSAEIGIQSWSNGMDHEVVNDYWKRIYGLSPDTVVTFDIWYNAIHPEDRERVIKEQNSKDQQYRVYDTVYRNIKPDGAVRWVVDRGNVRYDVNGHAISRAGINIDITERKLAETAIWASENQYRSMVENITDCVWHVNKDLIMTYVSPQSYAIFGYKPEELVGRTPFILVAPQEQKRVELEFSKILRKRCPCRRLSSPQFERMASGSAWSSVLNRYWIFAVLPRDIMVR